MGPVDFTHSLSVATVGTKGQIVIPQDIRERLGVKPGDKVVILMKNKGCAVVLPMEGMRAWLDKMSTDFDQLKNIVTDTSNTEEQKKGKTSASPHYQA